MASQPNPLQCKRKFHEYSAKLCSLPYLKIGTAIPPILITAKKATMASGIIGITCIGLCKFVQKGARKIR
jgi:hypothetical protein